MPIKFRCVHCGQYLGISHSKAGTVVDCPTCGRSVGVPQKDGQAERVGRPSLNHDDSQLVDALREVAAIAQSSEVALPQMPPNPSRSSDARETREVESPPPKVIPAKPLPPAQRVEPEPAPAPSTSQAKADPYSAFFADESEDTFYSRVPLMNLATMAQPAPEEPAPPKQEAVAYSHTPWTNEVPWKMWLSFIIIGFIAIVTGFALGRWDLKIEPPEKPSELKLDSDGTANSSFPASETAPAPSDEQTIYTGKVQYAQTPGGEIKPDANAWVYAFPLQRKGSETIPAEWLKAQTPADYATDHALIAAALQVMGGNAVQAASDGSFQLPLPKDGKFQLLVCSSHILNEASQSLGENVLKVLDNFFEDPAAFLDQRAYQYLPLILEDGKTKLPIDTLVPIRAASAKQ